MQLYRHVNALYAHDASCDYGTRCTAARRTALTASRIAQSAASGSTCGCSAIRHSRSRRASRVKPTPTRAGRDDRTHVLPLTRQRTMMMGLVPVVTRFLCGLPTNAQRSARRGQGCRRRRGDLPPKRSTAPDVAGPLPGSPACPGGTPRCRLGPSRNGRRIRTNRGTDGSDSPGTPGECRIRGPGCVS